MAWSIGTSIASIGITGASAILGAVLLAAVLTAAFGRSYVLSHVLLVNILAYQFLVLGVVISAVWLVFGYGHAGPAALGYRFPGWQTLSTAVLAGAAAVFLGSVLVTTIFNTLFPQYGLHGNAKEVLAGVHHHMPIVVRVLTVLWAGVEAPLAEETLFRGIIYQGLRHYFDERLDSVVAIFLAAVSSGLLFGLAHFEPKTLPILFLVGIVLAYVFQYGRSIYASALVHGILNASVAIYVLQSTG